VWGIAQVAEFTSGLLFLSIQIGVLKWVWDVKILESFSNLLEEIYSIYGLSEIYKTYQVDLLHIIQTVAHDPELV